MSGISYLQLFTIISIIIFVAVSAIRMLKIIRTPLHLRWELMPIPHNKEKFYYGGSHLEETEYWTKDIKKSSITELKAMGEEILFIKSLFERNRLLWWASYPFHIGLYLIVVFVVFLFIGAVAHNSGIAIAGDSGSFGQIIYYVTVITGISGIILGFAGGVGLLMQRMLRQDMRLYSVPADYFNLLLILGVLLFSFGSWFSGDPSFSGLRAYFAGTIALEHADVSGTLMTIQMILAGLFFIYLPFTHMIHFLAKYFAYHQIRWSDDPNVPGSRVSKKVAKQLGYTITWSAPHVKTGGTWAEAATDSERDLNE
ncbi:respiratory nitrate reductase subunit gamma [candidate division KSB1 bacterium]